MRKRVGEVYSTVGICGSFRKHLDDIEEAHTKFTDAGFTVLAPATVDAVKNPGDEFVLFESDSSDDPRILEGQYQEELLRSDVVYVCDPEGYTGGSVMLELGRLIDRAEVYFMQEPEDPTVRAMAKTALSVVSVEDLIRCMRTHNRVFQSREWPDADYPQKSNFTFDQLEWIA